MCNPDASIPSPSPTAATQTYSNLTYSRVSKNVPCLKAQKFPLSSWLSCHTPQNIRRFKLECKRNPLLLTRKTGWEAAGQHAVLNLPDLDSSPPRWWRLSPSTRITTALSCYVAGYTRRHFRAHAAVKLGTDQPITLLHYEVRLNFQTVADVIQSASDISDELMPVMTAAVRSDSEVSEGDSSEEDWNWLHAEYSWGIEVMSGTRARMTKFSNLRKTLRRAEVWNKLIAQKINWKGYSLYDDGSLNRNGFLIQMEMYLPLSLICQSMRDGIYSHVQNGIHVTSTTQCNSFRFSQWKLEVFGTMSWMNTSWKTRKSTGTTMPLAHSTITPVVFN